MTNPEHLVDIWEIQKNIGDSISFVPLDREKDVFDEKLCMHHSYYRIYYIAVNPLSNNAASYCWDALEKDGINTSKIKCKVCNGQVRHDVENKTNQIMYVKW